MYYCHQQWISPCCSLDLPDGTHPKCIIVLLHSLIMGSIALVPNIMNLKNILIALMSGCVDTWFEPLKNNIPFSHWSAGTCKQILSHSFHLHIEFLTS
jgi:hypothetical protein